MRFEGIGDGFAQDAQVGGGAGGGGGHAAPGEGGRLAEELVDLCLQIVRESRGPMRLWDLAGRLERRLGMPPVPPGQLCDAVKATLARIDDPRLGVLATSMPGVGYVYDAQNPDARPVRASR